MVKRTLPMSDKEIAEARRARIPEQIIGKMAQGFELTEHEKDVVRAHSMVYVRAHVKEKGEFVVRPHLRHIRETAEWKMVYVTDNPGNGVPTYYDKWIKKEGWDIHKTYGLVFEDEAQKQLRELKRKGIEATMERKMIPDGTLWVIYTKKS